MTRLREGWIEYFHLTLAVGCNVPAPFSNVSGNGSFVVDTAKVLPECALAPLAVCVRAPRVLQKERECGRAHQGRSNL